LAGGRRQARKRVDERAAGVRAGGRLDRWGGAFFYGRGVLLVFVFLPDQNAHTFPHDDVLIIQGHSLLIVHGYTYMVHHGFVVVIDVGVVQLLLLLLLLFQISE
jgi:hypothetical protein